MEDQITFDNSIRTIAMSKDDRFVPIPQSITMVRFIFSMSQPTRSMMPCYEFQSDGVMGHWLSDILNLNFRSDSLVYDAVTYLTFGNDVKSGSVRCV